MDATYTPDPAMVGTGLLIARVVLGLIMAAISVHWEHGLFAASNGIELPLLYATGAFGIALAGPGPFSLDALLGLTSIWTPKLVWVVLALGVIGGFANLMARRRPSQTQSA